MIQKLFVQNIPHDMGISEIDDLFSQYGKVISVYVIKNNL